MRIAVATGDRDNFREICRVGSEFELVMGKSRVVLPGVEVKSEK
jgi:hypothetical protein